MWNNSCVRVMIPPPTGCRTVDNHEDEFKEESENAVEEERKKEYEQSHCPSPNSSQQLILSVGVYALPYITYHQPKLESVVVFSDGFLMSFHLVNDQHS